MSDPNGEFYVGYDDRMPPGNSRFVRRVVALSFCLVVIVSAVLVLSQNPFARSYFEFSNLRHFEGQLIFDPYARLISDQADSSGERASYYLVAPGKRGLPSDFGFLHGSRVKLKGKLVHRNGGQMIELNPIAIAPLEQTPPIEAKSPIGPITLTGEIVDSKCYLGVMNPGETKPHRACAIRCISGGIPPMLATRAQDGRARLYLLTDSNRQPINRDILPFIGIPVEVEGVAEQAGPVFFLRLSTDSIRPLR